MPDPVPVPMCSFFFRGGGRKRGNEATVGRCQGCHGCQRPSVFLLLAAVAETAPKAMRRRDALWSQAPRRLRLSPFLRRTWNPASQTAPPPSHARPRSGVRNSRAAPQHGSPRAPPAASLKPPAWRCFLGRCFHARKSESPSPSPPTSCSTGPASASSSDETAPSRPESEPAGPGTRHKTDNNQQNRRPVCAETALRPGQTARAPAGARAPLPSSAVSSPPALRTSCPRW